MQEIRYFGRLVDPAVYRRGFGFWGWLANAINVARVWLEKQTVLAVLRIECRKAGMSSVEIKDVVRQAAIHPDFVPDMGQSLPRFVRKLMRDHYPAAYMTLEERTAARYSEGRKNGEKKQNTRPVSVEEGMRLTFSRFQQKADRSARYVPGRRHFFVDYGDNIEPVPAPSRRRRNRMNQENQQNQQPGEAQPIPQPQQKPTLGENFAAGQQTRHLRLPDGLQKQGK